MIGQVLSGRNVELGALASSDSTILWPVLLTIAGVTILALIGHFAFRRDSRIRPRADETVESFDLFEEFEGFDRPGGIDPGLNATAVAAGERVPTDDPQ
jgi:hypothetical protein